MTSVVNRVNSISAHSEPIPSGIAKLHFVVRLKSGTRRTLLTGFTLGDDPEKRCVYLDESELLNFAKFQMRLLSLRGGLLADHQAAKNAAGKDKWYAEVCAAVKAGETEGITEGFRMFGSEN